MSRDLPKMPFLLMCFDASALPAKNSSHRRVSVASCDVKAQTSTDGMQSKYPSHELEHSWTMIEEGLRGAEPIITGNKLARKPAAQYMPCHLRCVDSLKVLEKLIHISILHCRTRSGGMGIKKEGF